MLGDQSTAMPEFEWSEALVLMALGRSIAESHASVLQEAIPAALDILLRQIACKGAAHGEH